MQPPIGDYALIGDCRGAALVSRAGSIDWLAWPRFDSPSLFARLLDERRGGCWQIGPARPGASSRRYLPQSNVLETRFFADGGELVLTDLMPVCSEADKRRELTPDHQLLRRVACARGEVEVVVTFDPRPDYARRAPRLVDAGPLGLRCEVDGGLLTLQAEVPLAPRPGGGVEARFRLRAGEAVRFSLTLALGAPAVLARLGEAADRAIDRSVAWWRAWAAALRYDGPYREAVVRSALTLRQLVYAPSGAVVAAPTTSLPERPGGDLNWDYRYCWLRDASLTVRALFGLGFSDEAEAFVSWLLHATRLTRPRLAILYDVHGERRARERTLPLDGYRGARPVRVGNAAVNQLQLDVYGEVIDATAQFFRRGNRLDRETRRMLTSFGDFVCRAWSWPDEGIWEPRSGRREHTHSRLLCWVALDRLMQLHVAGTLPKLDVARVCAERARIRKQIETRGWNRQLQSYVSILDGDHLDASLLLVGWYGFEPADSPRMKATYRRIRERLSAGDSLVYRYRSGDSPGEGAFGICGFWATELVALGAGSLDEAEASFESQLERANDLGLFAEELDPRTGDPLGNFPQAFSHVGLINAALSIERRRAHEAGRPREAHPGEFIHEARA